MEKKKREDKGRERRGEREEKSQGTVSRTDKGSTKVALNAVSVQECAEVLMASVAKWRSQRASALLG